MQVMDIEYPGFGEIVVEGTRFEHDVVIEKGVVRPRDKGPSRAHKRPGTHTLRCQRPKTYRGRTPVSSSGRVIQGAFRSCRIYATRRGRMGSSS